MSRWTGTDIKEFQPRTFDDHPGWVAIDCGCCNGIMWGGEEPRECCDCGASGWRYVHAATGVLADYPGGPLCGKATADEIKEARNTANARWAEGDGMTGIDYDDTERHGRAPADFANAIAEIVIRNFGRHVLFSQRHGVAQGVWNWLNDVEANP